VLQAQIVRVDVIVTKKHFLNVTRPHILAFFSTLRQDSCLIQMDLFVQRLLIRAYGYLQDVLK
jgi:hypothetical protein